MRFFRPRATRALAASIFCGLVGLLLTGCSGDDAGLGRLYPVRGTVTAAGTPLTKGSVTFYPEASKPNAAAFLPAGTIDEQGKYSLTTRGKEGAPAGKYKVVVSVQVPSNPKDPYSLPRSLVDPVYAKAETTPLVVEVKDSPPPGAYDLKLKK